MSVSRNDVFVQHGIRAVKLRQMSVSVFMRIGTDNILIGDAIQTNQWWF